MKLNLQSLFSKIVSFALFSVLFFSTDLKSAHADFNNLTPCKDSAAFQKRLTSSVKKLENRL